MYDLPCCRQVKFVVSQSFFLTFHGKKKRAVISLVLQYMKKCAIIGILQMFGLKGTYGY